MALNELETFMAAIRRVESFTYQGDYAARGPEITNPDSMYYGEQAYGAYQIMPGNWSAWAAEAGLANAPITSRTAQDAVARHKFTQYYREFGDWRLVAVAWFAGPGRARRAAREGMETVAGIKDVLGTSVATYVERITTAMRGAVENGYKPELDESVVARLDPEAQERIRRAPGLSTDDPMTGESDRLGLEAQTGTDGYFRQLASARPDLTALNQYVRTQPTNQEADLANSQMHQLMSGILQGISNAVRNSVPAMVQSSIDTKQFDVEV